MLPCYYSFHPEAYINCLVFSVTFSKLSKLFFINKQYVVSCCSVLIDCKGRSGLVFFSDVL